MSAQTLELLIIAYGSRDTDTLSDDRYGADQRRLEIALRPKLPRAGMNPQEISEWANLWSTLQYQSIKHSQKWCCEFCNKPARMSETTAMSWAHLTPPKINIYIHFVCNPSTGTCAAKLRALLFEVSLQAGRPPQRPVPPQVENPAEWPPMAACAGCEKEATATMLTRACAGCGVSRYCSEKCQAGHWRQHKTFCKTPKTVKYVGSWK